MAKQPKPREATGPASRIACLRVANLPLVAVLRALPELVGVPLAITAGPGPRAEILAASPEAQRHGIRPPAALIHARAACAALQVRLASPALERAARDGLLDVALSVSPRAEVAAPGTGLHASEAAVYLDASGSRALFHSEAGLAAALVERATRLGLPAVVGLAASRSTARIAARSLAPPEAGETGATLVVPPGGDATFLAPLPLELLDPDDALAEALDRFGLRCVEDLLRLPRRALLTRLGSRSRALLDRARGTETGTLPAAPRHTRFEEALDLEAPLDRLEPLAFVLRGLLARLGERLVCRALACGDLELELDLEGRGRDVRRVGVAAPTLDTRVLLRLLTLSLESRPPPAPVEQVRLATEGRDSRAAQLDLFRPAGPAPAALGRVLAELEALCGPGRVGAPVVADSHRPDAWALAPYTPPAPGAGRSCDLGSEPASSLAVRALRPPLAAEVRHRAGRPVWIRSAVANGRVLHAAGPWRSTGAWWSDEERWALDYFDVQTQDGTLLRLRLDRIRQRWQIDAIYD